MKTITREFVESLIDFAPTEELRQKGFADTQTDGAVALFNMLQQNSCAYLADEVGMGKTYVALGVMSLFRYFNPSARIIVIAPRENIQLKWKKELSNFVRNNWKTRGNRVKSLQGKPAWPPKLAHSFIELAHEAQTNADRDFFLRMTSFSIALNDPESRKKLRQRLMQAAPWIKRRDIPNSSKEAFRDGFGLALNRVIPHADLVVVDEAHNLKHGFGEHVSTRNRMMALVFGRDGALKIDSPSFRPKVGKLLLLSATPFEDDYSAIQRQLDVFGFGKIDTYDADGQDPISVSRLSCSDTDEWEKRRIVGRIMLRRVSGINMGGKLHTKNMYRREWRQGGYVDHEKPMAIDDPKQRLVVALMQKKVAEVLQHEKFNNSYQIGMLSSFESFLESTDTIVKNREAAERTGDEEDAAVFDGEDQLRSSTDAEKRGIDTDAIRTIVQSYRDQFGRSLPHPKLDATADALNIAFKTGEKSLVFVRRVATVNELAAKLDEFYDDWIKSRLLTALPDMEAAVQRMFNQYGDERKKRPEDRLETTLKDADETRAESDFEQARGDLDDDPGSAETFFAWFFRGTGPKGYLSGAAFRKNRFDGAGSQYSNFFEDDAIAWLLERPANALATLARELKLSPQKLRQELREKAWRGYSQHTKRQEGYPRRNVFAAYQAAALQLLGEVKGDLLQKATIVLYERYPTYRTIGDIYGEVPDRFPEPEQSIGIATFFTELVKSEALREQIWPRSRHQDFGQKFREQEQRRELLSGMCRLGSAYIDLYLLCIGEVGSFSLSGSSNEGFSDAALATEYVSLLESQREETGFSGYDELAAAAANFYLLIAVNFPDMPEAPLANLSRDIGATLQRQVPIGRMAGGVNKRLVRQFRMPGYPLVLISTDVLQEGEDLHTFCRRVVHYGISWTPSSIEQRTGRIDRIGGLVQRELDGRPTTADPDELIQIYYPHLSDTVEVLQVRRVLGRLNRFMRLAHKLDRQGEKERSTLNVATEILDMSEIVPQITGPLESAFPAKLAWLAGELGEEDAVLPDAALVLKKFKPMWSELLRGMSISENHAGDSSSFTGSIDLSCIAANLRSKSAVSATGNMQFSFELLSQTAGDKVILRCSCHVGQLRIDDENDIEAVYRAQIDLHHARVCARPSSIPKVDDLSIEKDTFFVPERTQLDDLVLIVAETVSSAAIVRASLINGSDT